MAASKRRMALRIVLAAHRLEADFVVEKRENRLVLRRLVVFANVESRRRVSYASVH